MMSDGGGMWFGGGFGWIFWIVIIAVLVWVIKMASDKGSASRSSNDDSPLEILKKRYARGEIDEQEFERKRKELNV